MTLYHFTVKSYKLGKLRIHVFYYYSDASLYRASQYRGIGYNAVDLGPRFFWPPGGDIVGVIIAHS